MPKNTSLLATMNSSGRHEDLSRLTAKMRKRANQLTQGIEDLQANAKALQELFDQLINHVVSPRLKMNRLWLLLCAAKASTTESVEGAAEMVRELSTDRHALEQLLARRRISRTNMAAIKECLTRLNRQLRRWEELLTKDFGVTIYRFEQGDQFNPDLHVLEDTEPAGAEDEHHTLAGYSEPAFQYMDEYGRSQVIPARVTVFSDDQLNEEAADASA